MDRGKYSAVIGSKETIAWKFVLGTCLKKRFSTNHGKYFPLMVHVHRITEFR